MPFEKLAQNFLLPELEVVHVFKSSKRGIQIRAVKKSEFEVCPKCATPSSRVHDYRTIKVKDAPFRGKLIYFEIKKRRFRCQNCKSVFTEPIAGVKKNARVTKRFERSVYWHCDQLQDLKKVRKAHDCGYKLIYRALYSELRKKQQERKNDPWPRTIGIDEHAFRRHSKRGVREFATMIVDYNNKRLKEVVLGKTGGELRYQLDHIEGRERVKNVVLDLADHYKSFVKDFFPNAKMVADKFHVLRLLHPAINRRRKQITGDKRNNPLRKLLLMNSKKLDYFQRKAIEKWLKDHPELAEIYYAKEWMHKLYRCRGKKWAGKSLTKLTDLLALSKVKELKTLRRTLMKWREEILNYFENRITNARTEGYNRVAKLLQRRSYGLRSFKNYRLRLLDACS